MKLRKKVNEDQSWLAHGLALAEKTTEDGGFHEYFDESDDLGIEDPYIKATTAIMMENAEDWLRGMNEATRSVNVGGYIDYILPVIRAGFPNQIAHDLVSVQPMTKRIGQVFFLNYRIGQDKGANYTRGRRVFDAIRGFAGGHHYSDEVIEQEDGGTTAAPAAATQSGQLAYLPVRRASVVLTFDEPAPNGPIVVRDDGNGQFVIVNAPGAPNAILASSISYETGVWSITFNGNLTASRAIVADYEYESEMSPTIPILDVELTASAITAKRRALRARYSMDGEMDYAAEFGQDLGMTIANGISEYIVAEQAREIIHDLWTFAGPAVANFNRTPPVGAAYSRTEHFRDFVEIVNIGSQSIYQATQRVFANWIVCDSNAASLLKTIPRPTFDSAPETTNTVGVQFIGTLQGKRVYLDPHLQDEPGSSPNGNVLLGFKGTEYWDAGYIWAPYQVFQTQNIVLDDFINRRAFAYRYAKKLINPNLYKRITIGP